MTNKTLDEVEIMADIARTRETPVAFTNVLPAEIDKELASQDIPMLLNKTPGVYATQQGGGDGDSRINIRGFSQRNVAVMIDGIPVNDMENGWVYWSNWFGLDAVTRKIQVQRGLGKSKLAIPSVGGTMNIITKGIESEPQFTIKQAVGNDNFRRFSISGSTGPLGNGWGLTFAFSDKKGEGYPDQTWTDGSFYFMRIDKELGDHRLSLSAMGAPQEHGQRSYTQSIATWDVDYAREQGVDISKIKENAPNAPLDKGLKYNRHWGYLERYKIDRNGDTLHAPRKKYNTRQNYYHKPRFNLRDYWKVNKDLFISNIAYLSVGKGGGTRLNNTRLTENGQIDLQTSYDNNYNNQYSPGRANDIIMSSRNDHFWVGLLSQADYRISGVFNLSGGIDMRYYKGEHYQETYDFLGGEYYLEEGQYSELTDPTRPSIRRDEIGDIINFHNDGLVKWGGGFAQLEYESEKFTSFLNLSVAQKSYKRVDYFRKEDLVIDGERHEEQVGYEYDYVQEKLIPDTAVIDGKKYTINSPEAEPASTEWLPFLSYTAKLGANYNFNENFNAFANIGYINKPPRFNNVFDYSNNKFRNIKNESVEAVELGFSYYSENLTLNVNSYYTKWYDKPASSTPTIQADEETYKVNINGMDALHKGVEVEFAHEVLPKLRYDVVISVGDWRWTSKDTARVYDEQQEYVGNVAFNAKDVHVGDAAQHQARLSLNWKPVRDLYVRPSITYFGKHYSNFAPLSLSSSTIAGYSFGSNDYLDEDGNPKDSWKVPNYYLVDLHTGYTVHYQDLDIQFQLSVLNVLDHVYISDADNNSQYTDYSQYNFDAGSAAVFFGLGRRWNASVSISF